MCRSIWICVVSVFRRLVRVWLHITNLQRCKRERGIVWHHWKLLPFWLWHCVSVLEGPNILENQTECFHIQPHSPRFGGWKTLQSFETVGTTHQVTQKTQTLRNSNVGSTNSTQFAIIGRFMYIFIWSVTGAATVEWQSAVERRAVMVPHKWHSVCHLPDACAIWSLTTVYQHYWCRMNDTRCAPRIFHSRVLTLRLYVIYVWF